MKKYLKHFLSAITVTVFLILALSSKEAFSNAKGKIVGDVQVEPGVGFINDEMDAGYKITFKLRNIGEAGIIKITATLSTSEGEWEREQSITFNAGESNDFEYFFHEPSVNVSSVHGSVNVFPN